MFTKIRNKLIFKNYQLVFYCGWNWIRIDKNFAFENLILFAKYLRTASCSQLLAEVLKFSMPSWLLIHCDYTTQGVWKLERYLVMRLLWKVIWEMQWKISLDVWMRRRERNEHAACKIDGRAREMDKFLDSQFWV